MKFNLNSNLLIVSKNEWDDLSQDIYTMEDTESKNMITCTVVQWTDKFNTWDIVLIGKYSLNKLIYKWVTYYIVEQEDCKGTIEE